MNSNNWRQFLEKLCEIIWKTEIFLLLLKQKIMITTWLLCWFSINVKFRQLTSDCSQLLYTKLHCLQRSWAKEKKKEKNKEKLTKRRKKQQKLSKDSGYNKSCYTYYVKTIAPQRLMLCIVFATFGHFENWKNRQKPAHIHVITEFNERHQELSASFFAVLFSH